MLLCQRDAYLRRAECEIVSCEERGGSFQSVLSDSVLYPGGGGQPPDFGTIAGQQVQELYKDPEGRVCCITSQALAPGLATQEVDWPRRFDFMQQHSAQHLLTAIAHHQLDAPTLAFHLGEEYAAIELDTPSFGADSQRELLERANALIREARPIRAVEMSPEEYEASGARSRLLPKDHVGNFRLVEIADLDLNTCGGTHVRSTAELQMIAFVGIERARKRFRLSFLAGDRLLQHFGHQNQREKQLTEFLNAGPDEHFARIQASQEELRKERHQLEQLTRDLGEALGQAYAARAPEVCVLHREHTDIRRLEWIASSFLKAHPEGLIFLTGSLETAGEGVFLLAGDPQEVKRWGALALEHMDGRGGGRPGRFQGKVAQIEGREALVHALSTKESP